MARAALFNMLTGILNTNDNLVIWDAFAGSGAFGLEFLSRAPHTKVIFTDIDPQTVNKNLHAIGAVATVQQTDALAAVSKFGADADVVFIDPPRKGCDKNVIETLLNVKPNKIVYISCNPATLARDLKVLEEEYSLKKIAICDMFPWTSHVECVAFLNLGKS